jgi:16S rRNA processing protein RimM
VLAPEAWVPLAEVARPHGVRGELRLRPFNRDSDLLLEIDEVLVRFPDGEEHEVTVEDARRANDAILMTLTSVDDRGRAGELRGAVLCVRRSDFPPIGPGEFYACDVEGARVVLDPGGGQELSDVGKVKELRTYPTADVLVVAAADGGRDLELPLVDAIVREVDVAAGIVTIATLDGVERV